MPNNQQNNIINIEDLNTAAKQTLIHIDLNKTFYSITSPELTVLENGAASIWKDISLLGYGLGIPCAINALIENSKSENFNSEIFWNSLTAGISIVIAVIFSIIWYRSSNTCKDLIKNIKERPKYKIQ